MQPNQWQQQQYGYPSFQQPQQTGAPGQGFSNNPSFMQSQPTGYPGGGGMQPMQTGFQPQQQRPQQTGMPGQGGAGGNYSFLSQPPQLPQSTGSFRSSNLTPQMTGYPGGGASGLLPQQTGYSGGGLMSQPTGMMSQPTGMGMGGLQPQATGLPHDPRLQQMMQSFMPSNLSQPFAASGMPQFNQPQTQQPLTQSFQSLLQNPSVNTPKVPWTLSRQEKKDYDQIFRAWDTKGDGFITGEMAREVFGQSGLDQDNLMKIWNLSDKDNRGKLNLPEFHVAMGLIYRALNGNTIPDVLPEELVPASMRDIDTTVNFMKDLLRHEATSRSNASSPGYGSSSPAPPSNSKDALMYKHSDDRSTTYKPSSRHLDRKSVRYAGEDPDAGLKDIRRKLENTSTLLEKSAEKSIEDEELEEEIETLQYRVKRIQEDIEYTSKGRRTAEKDKERRELERELLYLMHEKLPEIERKQERRAEEKAMEERAGVRRRDERNQTHGRYDNRDRDRGGDDYDRYRGTFEGDRSRDRYDRDRRDERDRDRDYDRYGRDRRSSYDRDRPRSPPASRTPPPAPPPASVSAAASAPPPPPAPAQAAAPSTKNMTPEERKAYIREQAQKRINDRLRALGVESAPAEESVDTSVQDRLEKEKKEAEEKSKQAEAEQASRDEARKKRLAEAGGSTAEEEKPPAPPSPAGPLKSAMKKPAAPPAPPSRPKVAPPPPASKHTSAQAAPPAPTPPKIVAPDEDPEEIELRRKEEAAAKARADRKARLEALQREEEEERKQEEALLAARQNRSKAPSPGVPAPTVNQDPPVAPPPPPPAPAAPSETSYNPFRKPGAAPGATPSPAAPAAGGFNPFFKPPAAASGPTSPAVKSPEPATAAPPPPPPPPPAPPAAAPPSKTAFRSPPSEPEWEDINEKEADSDDSSDDETFSSRVGRQGLAQALFGNILGSGGSGSPTGSRPGSAAPAAPPAPKAPSAALANLGGGDPGQSRGALLSAIQGGARLKKTQTVDKSGPPGIGKVVGDAAPPSHINDQPRTVSPPPQAQPVEEDDGFSTRNANRQSVDWYAGLAADSTHPAASHAEEASLEPTREEDEPASNGYEQVKENGEGDELDDFDLTKTLRVRSLYEFAGTRDVDLSFKEDVVLEAHPAKDASSAWWYGTLVKEGSKGWFPKDYVEELQVTRAKALFDYPGGEEDQLPFMEGDVIEIVDKSDQDWWKTEKAGVIFLVPASYLEIQDRESETTTKKADPVLDITPPQESHTDVISQPPIPRPASHNDTQPRPTSMLSVASSMGRSPSLISDEEDEGSSSSDDSVLSWWSSDEDGSSDEEEGEGEAVEREVDEEKEAERKRREKERQKILSAAGLQIKREPPPRPGNFVPGRVVSRRRPPPGVPGSKQKQKQKQKRRKAPAVPQLTSISPSPSPSPSKPSNNSRTSDEPQDAYARYEAFLAQSQSQTQRPNSLRVNSSGGGRTRSQSLMQQVTTSQSITPQLTGPNASAITSTTPHSPTPSQSLSLSGSGSGIGIGGGGGGKISGFFNKLMTNTTGTHQNHTGSSAKHPSISGPITRVESTDVSRPDTPTPTTTSEFGKTWGSLVEPSVLATMSERERKRQEAIFEFIATEGGYGRDLQLIVEVFYAALIPLLDEKSLEIIFANIEDILLFNTSFLSSLEDRQKSCRLYIDRIGDVLEEYLENAGVYTTYCVNQPAAIKVLQNLRETNPELSSLLVSIRDTNPAVRGLDLSHFLLSPMQRITRYPLLIKQIIHYTDTLDPSDELNTDLPRVENALKMVESIVGQINESVREAEGEERLKALSENLWIGGEGRLDLTAPTALLGPRRLLKEGKVSKLKSGRKLNMVLCNDIIVLLDGTDLYRMPLPLHEVQIRQGRDETAFTLKIDARRGGDTIALRGTNGRDVKDWIRLITHARSNALDARKGRR
uniref:Actin cytoskeleton-regulatory complex protein PAN1 n=1 Tax=Kwoniella dejecticola CBS 10117 TaxID=1296121 RepID=A0A1A6A990_9TREE|nr:multidomain RhoGEF [Kwoniella dejecticola CBS 10117]OBR86626.1 multidomain RhoGEF [Kwoniella dejecticola CBS 10117]